MAGPRTYCNLLFSGKDKLTGALTKGNSTSAVSCAPTFALAQTHASTPTPASTPGLLGRYTDKDLQKAIKLAIELFVKGQEYHQLQANSAPCELLFKARFPDLYYGNLHLNCYCLYQ